MSDADNKRRIHALNQHDKHERWIALSEVERHFDNEEFWSTFIDVWTSSESNGRFMPLIRGLVLDRLTVPRESSWLGMSRDQKAFLSGLPEQVQVFRGCAFETPFTSWSFTIKEETARWFADHRVVAGTACVASARVDREHILFVDNREDEIVIDPDRLLDIEYTIIPARSEEERKQAAFFMEVQNGLYADEASLLQMDLVRISGLKMSVDAYVTKILGLAEEFEELGFLAKPSAIRGRMETLRERLSDETSEEYAYVFPSA